MSIPGFARTNFQTLLRAAGDGNLVLMECLDAETAQPRYVICAVGRDGADYVFTPLRTLGRRQSVRRLSPARSRRPDRLPARGRHGRPGMTITP